MTVAEHERQVELHYDEITANYLGGWSADHIHLGLFEPGEFPEDLTRMTESAGLQRALERMVDVIAAPARIDDTHHVVDAGCGVGGTAIYLAKTRGCSVTGVNVARRQLEIATEKTAAAGLDDRVRFRHADCSQHLPFADNSIDTVINVESACHYSDRGTFLREVHRILKPGGRIVAMDWLGRDDLTAEEFEEHILPLCEPWVVFPLERQSTYTRRLAEAGLSLVEFEGFGGKDADNIRVLGYRHRQLTSLVLSGAGSPPIREMAQRIGLLHRAWSRGFFEIRRYCAEKARSG